MRHFDPYIALGFLGNAQSITVQPYTSNLMNFAFKAIVAALGGTLALVLGVSALRNASLIYAIQAITAIAVTYALFTSISKNKALSDKQVSRNKKLIAIGLAIGLFAPLLFIWLIVQSSKHG